MQSGTNVPYMKISAIDYSQNINGDYKATVTGGGEGIATLIPVLNGVHQAGLSTTIQFTRAEDKIMSGTVSVNGTDLPTTTFPSQYHNTIHSRRRQNNERYSISQWY